MHISSSYAKILGEKLFRTWEFPRSGSKAKDKGERRKRGKRPKVGNNNGYGLPTTPRVAHASRLGQKEEERDKVEKVERKSVLTMAW